MEVDALDTGVGAVLSQNSELDNKIPPCAFFSHRLSLAERSYDMGDHELLAIKLTGVATLARGNSATSAGLDRSQKSFIHPNR